MGYRRDEILRSLLEESIPPADNSGRGHDFHPPWRERYSDGTLGPWYGPPTGSAYRRSLQAYQDARGWSPSGLGGGGTCVRIVTVDGHEERQEMPAKAPRVERYDAEEIAAFVRARHAELGTRLVEVAVCYWTQRQSAGWVARRLGIARKTVLNYVVELRRRARVWAAERRR